MNKIRISKKDKKELIQFARDIYEEVDDDEIPEIILNDAFNRGYRKGMMVNDNVYRKSMRESLKRIKKSVGETLEKELEIIIKSLDY